MKLLFRFATRVGTFYIGQSPDGRFHAIFNDDSYGSYEHIWQPAEDLAFGATWSIPGIESTAKLGIPEDVNEWERIN